MQIRGGAEVETPAESVVEACRRPMAASRKPTGGKAVCWTRHSVYWAIALVLILPWSPLTDTTPAPAQSTRWRSIAWFAWLVVAVILIAIAGLPVHAPAMGAARRRADPSRCLVVSLALLGFVAIVLFEARRWGVHIEACHTVGELETCQGQASTAAGAWQLAWHAPTWYQS